MNPWTAALQAPLSMGILQAKRLEWVTIPSPPGDLPNQGIESKSLALQANSLLPKPPGKPSKKLEECVKCCCFFLVLSPKSCLTLCDPMELCSLPGSSVHGIFQARILEWAAISSSRGSSQPRDRTNVSFISCIGRW